MGSSPELRGGYECAEEAEGGRDSLSGSLSSRSHPPSHLILPSLPLLRVFSSCSTLTSRGCRRRRRCRLPPLTNGRLSHAPDETRPAQCESCRQTHRGAEGGKEVWHSLCAGWEAQKTARAACFTQALACMSVLRRAGCQPRVRPRGWTRALGSRLCSRGGPIAAGGSVGLGLHCHSRL